MGATERLYAPALQRFAVALVPFFCGLAGVVIANIPISFVGGLVPPPLLGLIPVYFWCLVRPDLMSPAAVLVIGLTEDLLSGGPPGVWTLSFVLTYALVARRRDSFAGLSGLVAVLGFAAAAAFACAVAWVLVAGLRGHMPPIGPIVSQLAMTVLFYAPTVYVVGAIHHRLVGASRGDI